MVRLLVVSGNSCFLGLTAFNVSSQAVWLFGAPAPSLPVSGGIGVAVGGLGAVLLWRLLEERPRLGGQKASTLPNAFEHPSQGHPLLHDVLLPRLSAIAESGAFSASSLRLLLDRLETLTRFRPNEGLLAVLDRQYAIAIESERFYEQTVWRIAGIFIPSSLALAGYGMSEPRNMLAIGAGFAIYVLFLVLFSRFRVSIRLYREYAVLLEAVLGYSALHFVYKDNPRAFGGIVRVWTLIVGFGALFGNIVLWLGFRGV